MSTKLELDLDCDGVLSDFVTPFLKEYNRLTGTTHKPEDVTKWDMFEQLDMDMSLVNKIVCSKGFVESLPMLRVDLPEVIRELGKKYDLYVVTAPWHSSPFWEYERKGWLESRLGIPRNRVLSVSAKHKIQSDIFVDDAPKNLIKSRSHTRLLFDACYNRQCSPDAYDERILDLTTLL